MPRKNILTALIFLAVFGLGLFAFSAPAQAAPSIISPTQGSILTPEKATFLWDANGAMVTKWRLWIGNCSKNSPNYYVPSSCEDNLYNGEFSGQNTSKTVYGFPEDGRKIYVRLLYEISGSWDSKLFEFTANICTDCDSIGRFFKGHNTFYQEIPQDITVISKKGDETIVDNLYEASPTFDLSYGGIPDGPDECCGKGIFFADDWARQNRVDVSVTNWSCSGRTGFPECPNLKKPVCNFPGGHDNQQDAIEDHGWNLNIPIPKGTIPAGNNRLCQNDDFVDYDSPVYIVDTLNREVWEFSQVGHCKNSEWSGGEADSNNPKDGVWSAIGLRKYSLDGEGGYLWKPPFSNSSNIYGEYDSHSAIGSQGGSLLLGLVTYDEVVRKGKIDHAITITSRRSAQQDSTSDDINPYPAMTSGAGYTRPKGVKFGQRFRLKNDFDCLSINDEGAVKIKMMICKALKEYGAIFRDWSQAFDTDAEKGAVSVDMQDLHFDPKGRSWINGLFNLTFSRDDSDRMYQSFELIEPVYPDCDDSKDNDGDGKIDSFDPDCNNDITDWETPDATSPADINSDGKVNIKDIQACIKVITRSDLTYENQCRILAPPTDRTNIKDIQVIIREIIK